MMPIAHSSRYTTVLNPPNLAGFGAAADKRVRTAASEYDPVLEN
jgi:hypothetical protein